MNVATYPIVEVCAGVGMLGEGLGLALPGRFRTIAYAEKALYPAGVLARRMEEGHLDRAPIWDDVKTLRSKAFTEFLRGAVEGRAWGLIGGIPCQPFSAAGKQLGADDPRDLWPHVARAIEFWQSLGIGPELVFIENVGGSTDGLLDRLVPDLQQLGYGVASGIYSAKETGSTHRRDRTFTLGLADAAPAKQERSMAWAERQSGAGLNDCLPRLADASALGSALGSARLSREHSRPGDDLGATDGTEGRLRESRGACDGLDDTAPDRRDKRPVDDSTRRASENTPRREPGLVSFYPPGKNDDDGWARRLWELGPFSAPVVLLPPSRGWTGDSEAAEPNVRGFVDGLASGLGYRRQAIECIGNGVSPETVALAFLSLIGNHICGRTAGRAV